MKASGIQIRLSDALRIKSAELWLRLGHPDQALLELQRLSATGKKHPWAMSVVAVAMGAAEASA